MIIHTSKRNKKMNLRRKWKNQGKRYIKIKTDYKKMWLKKVLYGGVKVKKKKIKNVVLQHKKFTRRSVSTSVMTSQRKRTNKTGKKNVRIFYWNLERISNMRVRAF